MSIPIAPLADLVGMKLNSFRVKDLSHLGTLDEAGLRSEQLESDLPPLLRERLAQTREQFLSERPDIEG